MNSNIKAALNSCDNLKCKENAGGRFRITKAGIPTGSLWLEVQQECYRLKLTGEVKSVLMNYVNNSTELKHTEDQGDPVWHLPFSGLMEDIVQQLNKI